jgi:hypothetical protein
MTGSNGGGLHKTQITIMLRRNVGSVLGVILCFALISAGPLSRNNVHWHQLDFFITAIV